MYKNKVNGYYYGNIISKNNINDKLVVYIDKEDQIIDFYDIK